MFYKTLDQCIASLIWNGKSHRIKRKYLERPKRLAGLALPNFIHHYWACNIQKMLFWSEDYHPDRSKAWMHLECAGCPVHLGSFICAPSLPTPLNHFFSNPVVFNSIKIWSQFRKHFKLSIMSINLPIVNSYSFLPSTLDSAFKTWRTKGITSVSSLFLQANSDNFHNSLRCLTCRNPTFTDISK